MCETASEEMSFEVLAASNGMPESFDSSEFSLIPEPQPLSIENVANHVINGGLGISNTDSTLMSASQDLGVEEVQTRLVELLEDNETMKEALKFNNAMMKEQLSTISAWHNQMTTSMSQQKLSLKEANDRVQELEKENAELHKKINEQEITSTNAPDGETSEKDDMSSTNMLITSKDQMNVELMKKVEEQNSEIETLKRCSEEMDKEKVALESQQLELQARCKNLLEQIAKSELHLKDLDTTNETVLRPYSDKISELQSNITLEKHMTEVERMKHAETRKLFNVLQSNYDRVTKLLEIQTRDQKEKNEYTNSERELAGKQYLEQVDNLTAKLIDIEQKLEEREERVKELTVELESLKQESESIPILKAQGEVYKIDLSNAVIAREAAHEEVEKLKKEVNDLQSLVYFCSSCGAGTVSGDGPSRSKGRRRSSPESHSAGRRKQSDSHSEPETNLFVCPMCGFGFKDLLAAENHVNNCIDKAPA